MRVVVGAVFDVVVDLRRSSPTFCKWIGVELSATNLCMLWISPGMAHGFYVLSDTADLLYKSDAHYDPEDERVIRWDDPDLDIDWPLDANREPLLSARDAVGELVCEAKVYD